MISADIRDDEALGLLHSSEMNSLEHAQESENESMPNDFVRNNIKIKKQNELGTKVEKPRKKSSIARKTKTKKSYQQAISKQNNTKKNKFFLSENTNETELVSDNDYFNGLNKDYLSNDSPKKEFHSLLSPGSRRILVFYDNKKNDNILNDNHKKPKGKTRNNEETTMTGRKETIKYAESMNYIDLMTKEETNDKAEKMETDEDSLNEIETFSCNDFKTNGLECGENTQMNQLETNDCNDLKTSGYDSGENNHMNQLETNGKSNLINENCDLNISNQSREVTKKEAQRSSKPPKRTRKILDYMKMFHS